MRKKGLRKKGNYSPSLLKAGLKKGELKAPHLGGWGVEGGREKVDLKLKTISYKIDY